MTPEATPDGARGAPAEPDAGRSAEAAPAFPAKALHVLDHSLPLHSGYAFRSHNILRAQRARGHDPVALTSPKHEESWDAPGAPCEEFDGLRYYRTGATARGRVHAGAELRLIGALSRRIVEVSAIERPDLLHAHSPVLTALAALRARRALRIPLVYEIRAFWEDAAVDHGTYREGSWKYRAVRSLESWVCRRADRVTVLCEGIQRDLIGRGIPAEKLVVVSNAIDPHEFARREADPSLRARWGLEGKRVLGFLGSFYRYEGLDLLLEAFSRIAPDHPDLTLLLAGGGETEEELRSDVARRGLTSRVMLTGRVPHEQIADLYALVDVLAYPRRSMRLTELTTPLKPLEAMAMGKAMVASDVGGHRELIRDGVTGLLVRPGDAAALADGLTRVLADHGLKRRLEEAGPPWVRDHHTWERTTRAYDEVYARALGRRSASPAAGRRATAREGVA